VVSRTNVATSAVARAVLEDALGTGDVSSLDALSDGVVVDSPLRDDTFTGHEGFREYANAVRLAFPDARFELHDSIGDADAAALRWTLHGTHRGPVAFLPASDRTVSVEALELYRFDEDGRVVEIVTRLNQLRFFEQIGLVPEGTGPATPPPRPVQAILKLRIGYLRMRAPDYVEPTAAETDAGREPDADPATARTRRVAVAAFERYIRDYDMTDVSLLAPDLELYTHARPEPYVGPDGLASFLGQIHDGFPDACFTLDRVVAEDDTAVMQWTLQATNLGPLFGFPPTNRPVRLTALELMRVGEDGLLHEVRLMIDPLSILRQVGMLPSRVGRPLRWLIERRVGKGRH
jgi:steroid delta-isomerase-like uncharacterized protein